MNTRPNNLPPYTLPVILSGLAHFFLGASSLYWRALSEVPPTTLVAYRIILSTAIISLFILFFRRTTHQDPFKPKTLVLHCIASLFIAANWGVFIWSSINGHLLESGLGYLLAPFISVVLGVVIYREAVKTRDTLSICIALCVITVFILLTDNLNHWTYLLIATTWGAYTYLKKASPLDAINGVFIETLFLTICLALIIWLFDFNVLRPSGLSD